MIDILTATAMEAMKVIVMLTVIGSHESIMYLLEIMQSHSDTSVRGRDETTRVTVAAHDTLLISPHRKRKLGHPEVSHIL